MLGCASPLLTCETRFVTAPLGPATPVSRAVLDRLRSAVGPAGIIEDATDIAPYCKSWRDDWQGAVPAVLRPRSTEEVAAIVRICADAGVAIVPQGGNTGLTGASQPHADLSEVIVSTSRMKTIRAIDPSNDTISVDAGVILKDIQSAADAADRLFPLSLGAEGSCQIGGNISTNAGGVQVLRYGNTRNLVLGLEVVLPDGTIWNGLRALRKDNSGYDLKQLFIGREERSASSPAPSSAFSPNRRRAKRPGSPSTALRRASPCWATCAVTWARPSRPSSCCAAPSSTSC